MGTDVSWEAPGFVPLSLSMSEEEVEQVNSERTNQEAHRDTGRGRLGTRPQGAG